MTDYRDLLHFWAGALTTSLAIAGIWLVVTGHPEACLVVCSVAIVIGVFNILDMLIDMLAHRLANFRAKQEIS